MLKGKVSVSYGIGVRDMDVPEIFTGTTLLLTVTSPYLLGLSKQRTKNDSIQADI